MNEPQIIPLHTVFEDITLATELARVIKRRALEESFTNGERPDGARLSIDDPVRRVKACFDPFWTLPIKDEIGRRGYLCEDLLEVGVILRDTGIYGHVDSYDTQVAIPWGPGGRWQSAYDFVLAGGRVVSCKSSTGNSIEKLKPSSANIAQERRMLALDARPAGTRFDVWMVHPGSLAARGPFTYQLEQEHIDAALEEAYRVGMAWSYFDKVKRTGGDPREDEAWDDPAAWLEAWGLESTSGAFRYSRLNASDAIMARATSFLRARARASEAKTDVELHRDLIRPHIEEQLALARKADPKAKSVELYVGDELVSFSIDARGALRADAKKAAVAGVAAA